MKLVFWQPFSSFHQRGLLTALAEAEWVESVTLKVESDLPEDRRGMGWVAPDLPGVKVERIRKGEIPGDSAEIRHMFTGFGSHPEIWSAFHRLPASSACHGYAYTEAPDFTGPRGRLRRAVYAGRVGKLKELDGILATGASSAQFYRAICGDRIPVHAFGYYDAREKEIGVKKGVSPCNCRAFSPSAEEKSKNDTIHGLTPFSFSFLVAGQLIRRKGVDLLLRALAGLSGFSWTLEVAGQGPEEASLRNLASRLGVADRIQWSGVLKRDELIEAYGRADGLVLPSRFEGWGMSVNEALRAGCPVRASTLSGAATLLPEAWRLKPTVEDIRICLEDWLKMTETGRERERHQALVLAKRTTGEIGSLRLREILTA